MNKFVQLIPQLQQPRLALVAATIALASLAACNQPGNETAGQKVDRGMATAEQKAERAGNKIEAGVDRAADATSDAATTAAVKAALIAAPDLSSLRIDVDTKGSIVTLNGTVKSEAQKSQAIDVAGKVNGVKSVVNNLSISS